MTQPPADMDVLSDLLRCVRLTGAVFFRADFTMPWALASPDAGALAALVLPQARHLVMFHCIESGSCWIEVGRLSREELDAGDVVILPFGDAHVMGRGPARRVERLASLFPGPPPWPTPPSLVHGGAGAATRLICGFLHCDQTLFNPLLSSLPRLLVVHPDASPGGMLLRSSVDFLSRELDHAAPGSETVMGRLTELLFVEALRQHMAQLPKAQLGWLAALKDRGVRRSLELIHGDPAHPWTVDALARRSALSRSGLAARFTQLLGEPPARYLARWRLQLASQRLRETDEGLATIAQAVGYASEAALSRAFKREVGRSPAQFRQLTRR